MKNVLTLLRVPNTALYACRIFPISSFEIVNMTSIGGSTVYISANRMVDYMDLFVAMSMAIGWSFGLI
jgi:hypothetical protein